MPGVLLICGCPRSGTTGFRSIIARDPRLGIGLERYLRRAVNGQISAELFTPKRFADVQPDDTQVQPNHPSWENGQATIQHAVDNYATLDYIGDKLPRLANSYQNLVDEIPDCKILYLLRNPFDVAASYNKRARSQSRNNKQWRAATDYRLAIEHWNFDVQQTARYFDKLDFHIVCYETMYASIQNFQEVYDFIGLELTDHIKGVWKAAHERGKKLEAQRAALTDAEKVHICLKADFATYRDLMDKAGLSDFEAPEELPEEA